MRLLAPLALAALAPVMMTGCKTTSAEPVITEYPFLLVETAPSDATVSFADGTTCQTPCRVNVTSTMRMTLAKPGYKKIVYTLYGNAPGELMVELEQIAATTDVETTALPDL